MIKMPLLAYEVEDLSDGRKVLVTKPGGKSVHNIMVWIYEGPEGRHWRPSHTLIYRDLEAKLEESREQGLKVIEALKAVYEGQDPDDVLRPDPRLGQGLSGLPVDLILKSYKWIWAQEDCNYPPPRYQGRQMSMDAIEKLYRLFA
ncbi:MAG: glutamyl-tRNA amidotransferase [Dehalococcoidia bacterium]